MFKIRGQVFKGGLINTINFVRSAVLICCISTCLLMTTTRQRKLLWMQTSFMNIPKLQNKLLGNFTLNNLPQIDTSVHQCWLHKYYFHKVLPQPSPIGLLKHIQLLSKSLNTLSYFTQWPYHLSYFITAISSVLNKDFLE